jgi:hypothetical protein
MAHADDVPRGELAADFLTRLIVLAGSTWSICVVSMASQTCAAKACRIAASSSVNTPVFLFMASPTPMISPSGISDRHGKECFGAIADLLIDLFEE